MLGILDKTPLIALSRCHDEKGTTIGVLGDWWEGHTVSEKGLVFKCSAIEWDPDYRWDAGSRDRVPNGAFTLRVVGRSEEPQPYKISHLASLLHRT